MFNKFLGRLQRIEFTDINKLKIFSNYAIYRIFDRKPHIEVHYRKAYTFDIINRQTSLFNILLHEFRHFVAKDVNTGECQRTARFRINLGRHYMVIATISVHPAQKAQCIMIKKQETACHALADKQCSKSIILHLRLKPMDIAVGKDVDIVDKETSAAFEETARMQHSTTGFKQKLTLVAYLEQHFADTGIPPRKRNPILRFNPLLHLVGKIMDIDNNLINSRRLQFTGNMFNKRFITHRHQSLGKSISKGFKTRSQTCSKNHSFHKTTFYPRR